MYRTEGCFFMTENFVCTTTAADSDLSYLYVGM